MNSLVSDRRGAVILETLIAFLPILFFFLGICSAADGYAHYLIVQRAASAAARAAVVVLPDHQGHYANTPLHRYERQRKRDIERAAQLVLDHSELFRGGRRSVRLVGYRPPRPRQKGAPSEPITVAVTAEYKCVLPLLNLVCGRARRLDLTAQASLPYQGADYRY